MTIMSCKKSQILIYAYITAILVKLKDLAKKLQIYHSKINMTPIKGQMSIIRCKRSRISIF